MDVATMLGIVFGVAFILIGIFQTGTLQTYWDLPSLMITFGGTIAGTLIAYPISQIIGVLKVVRNVFQRRLPSPESVIQQLVHFVEKARREGILALEDEVEALDDEFLKKGLQLVVDGSDPELVRNILETELAFVEERHKAGQSIFITMATLAPAFGMIGTLIGLINMLKNLDNPSVIGPNMATALITTFYGAIYANLICIPIATKLNVRSGEEILLKELVIEGVLSLQAGENPRLVEEKLKAFLPPKARNSFSARTGAQVGG
ncbi:MAG: chemotaxis protein MotA [Bacillota bacterium]|nr:chemotaxis protein MotA [Bacillota bacterium]MDK2925041.1 chemotaxis protein MotA [Bacillota bacterium]